MLNNFLTDNEVDSVFNIYNCVVILWLLRDSKEFYSYVKVLEPLFMQRVLQAKHF